MVKTLRRKIIAITTLSVFFLLLILLTVANLTNYINVTSNADKITQVLFDNQGSFPDPSQGGPGGGMGKETPYETRYFSVEISPSNSIVRTKVEKVAAVDTSQANKMALSVINSATGYYGNYRYRNGTIPNGNKLIIFIDYTRELEPTKVFLYASIGVLSVGTLITFLVIYFLSKKIVKPIEESQKKQKRFISDASHELKTPITIISANNEILEMENGPSDITMAISKEVRRLNEMVKNLNALARLDEGEEMAFSTINLSDITNSTCEPFINSFKAQNKELILNITDDITIKGNEASIRKLISIILDNALKYSLSRAQVEVKKQGERIIFLERNDALNFENGIHDEVFGRFFRSDDARGSEIEGTGIGLSIAKEIATMHKAKIMSYGEEGDFVIKVEF